MVPGNKFRAQVEECINAAGSAADAGRKLVFLELARRWLALAAQADALYERNTLRGDVLLDESKPTRH